MTYTPTCPYITEVEIKAWGEGLTAGLHTEAKRIDNPYTAADTSVAWIFGLEDASYMPAPFNPTDLWDGNEPPDAAPYHKENSFTNELYVHVNANKTREIWLLWRWSAGYLDAEWAPKWTHNRHRDRGIQLSWNNAIQMIRRGLYSELISDSSIDLPCPPYTFEYSDGGMEISAGKFKKWGSKDDWEMVIDQMKEAWEAIPPGLDVSDASISLMVTQPATARWSVSIDVETLLGYSDQLDGSTYSGTEDELEQEVINAIENLDNSEVSNYYNDVEYEVDDYGDVEVECEDLTYDLQDVREA